MARSAPAAPVATRRRSCRSSTVCSDDPVESGAVGLRLAARTQRLVVGGRIDVGDHRRVVYCQLEHAVSIEELAETDRGVEARHVADDRGRDRERMAVLATKGGN